MAGDDGKEDRFENLKLQAQRANMGAIRWFARNETPYPPRTQQSVEYFFSGEEVFAALAEDMKRAQKSILYIAWGLNPNFIMKRDRLAINLPMLINHNYRQPITDTEYIFREIIEERARAGVRCKILVWHPAMARQFGKEEGSREDSGAAPDALFLWAHSLRLRNVPVELKLVSDVDVSAIGRTNFPTQHQKNVIIDIEDPKTSIGYVMGHNTVPFYWDTVDFPLMSEKRHFLLRLEKDGPSLSDRKYVAVYGEDPVKDNLHDYSARVRGMIVRDLYHNFNILWNKTNNGLSLSALKSFGSKYESVFEAFGDASYKTKGYHGYTGHPINILYPTSLEEPDLEPGHQAVNLLSGQHMQHDNAVRHDNDLTGVPVGNPVHKAPIVAKTQYIVTRVKPEGFNCPKSIREVYVKALVNAQNYVFMDNQYIRGVDILREVAEIRKTAGRPLNEVKFFIVGNDFDFEYTPHDAPQDDWRKGEGNNPKPYIDKTSNLEFETSQFLISEIGRGNFVHCVLKNRHHPHPQIYNHSKLLIVDDVFATSGSANFNPRSTVGDSEANIAIYDPQAARQLRVRAWQILLGDPILDEIKTKESAGEALTRWKKIALDNENVYNLRVVEERTSDGDVKQRWQTGTYMDVSEQDRRADPSGICLTGHTPLEQGFIIPHTPIDQRLDRFFLKRIGRHGLNKDSS